MGRTARLHRMEDLLPWTTQGNHRTHQHLSHINKYSWKVDWLFFLEFMTFCVKWKLFILNLFNICPKKKRNVTCLYEIKFSILYFMLLKLYSETNLCFYLMHNLTENAAKAQQSPSRSNAWVSRHQSTWLSAAQGSRPVLLHSHKSEWV